MFRGCAKKGAWKGRRLTFLANTPRPNELYHSYGVEANPSVYTGQLHGRAENVGIARGAKEPSFSMSGNSEKLARRIAGAWQVQRCTLPSVLDTWVMLY